MVAYVGWTERKEGVVVGVLSMFVGQVETGKVVASDCSVRGSEIRIVGIAVGEGGGIHTDRLIKS